MATIQLGKIKQVWRDVWSNGSNYAVDDLVSHVDQNITSTYIAVQASTSGSPQAPATSGTVNTSYWNLVAKGVADPVPAQSSSTNGKALISDGTNASWGDGGAWTKIAGGTGPASNVAGITLDNIFSADYKFYKIFLIWTQDDYWQYRWIKTADGATQSNSNYIWSQFYAAENAGAGPNRYGSNGANKGMISYWNANDGGSNITEVTIQDPYHSTEYSTLKADTVGNAGNTLSHQLTSSIYYGQESHRGIFLYGSAGDSINSVNFRYVVLGAKI